MNDFLHVLLIGVGTAILFLLLMLFVALMNTYVKIELIRREAQLRQSLDLPTFTHEKTTFLNGDQETEVKE